MWWVKKLSCWVGRGGVKFHSILYTYATSLQSSAPATLYHHNFCQMSAIMSLLLHLSLCHSERCEFRRMLLLLYHYHHFTGTPPGRRSGPARQECGELVTTHRDTFRGEALSSANAPSESVRRQQQRITCIPQGNILLHYHAWTVGKLFNQRRSLLFKLVHLVFIT